MWFKFWDRREWAVRRGIKLLDQQVPRWWEQINREQLDMSNPYHCVLGQLATANGWTGSYSPYGTATSRLGLLKSMSCRRHGFDTLQFGWEGYAWLDERWYDEIQKRQLASINN